jgi:hypothetical protein
MLMNTGIFFFICFVFPFIEASGCYSLYLNWFNFANYRRRWFTVRISLKWTSCSTVCYWWKYQFELEMPNSLLYHLKKITLIGRAEHITSSYTLSDMSAGVTLFSIILVKYKWNQLLLCSLN